MIFYNGLRLSLTKSYIYRNITKCFTPSIHFCEANNNIFNVAYRTNCFRQFHNNKSELNLFFISRRGYCIKFLDNDKDVENEHNSIKNLFPNPRVTLNEFADKRPGQTFEILYKQATITPRGSKKKTKTPPKNAWTCIYSFSWPQKEKFESTAISKKQAAEKAATQALFWLYKNNHIDKRGRPIYNEEVISDIKEKLDTPIRIEIAENSVERIKRIWIDYEDEFKEVFAEMHEKALERDVPITADVLQDSTLDNEDGVPENEKESSENYEQNDPNTFVHPVFGRYMKQPSVFALSRRRFQLEETFEESSRHLVPLPIDSYTSEICSVLKESRVAIIVGAAGCGKSTRTPRAILRENGVNTNIIVAQPRRVAALGLAERVADELMEEIGESVGYQVRLAAKLPSPPSGSILYATSGILLRRLLNNPGLFGCSHVIIDEAHERDINTDVILLLLKRALNINPDLKVVIMSATLNTHVFTKYFDNCPLIQVPGRSFPVKEVYIEDLPARYPGLVLRNTIQKCSSYGDKPYLYCDEIVSLIKTIDSKEPEGAILFFLPGWAEIKTIKNMLEKEFPDSNRHLILPVHSRLTTSDQTKIFSKPPPGVRKIVLSTNIAETSITIPDVVYVGDSGTHKETFTQVSGSNSIECVWISQAAAKQRAGRAGRIQPGYCFKLYTREKEKEFVEYNTPEILRVPLDQTVLQCKTYAPKERIEEFLSQLPEPPSNVAIQSAINDLVDLGALSVPHHNLSPLGAVLSMVTSPPRVSAMLVWGMVAGGVVAAAELVTQLADGVRVWGDLAGEGAREIRSIKSEFDPYSDHVALNKIQHTYEDIVRNEGKAKATKFCDKYSLRQDRLEFCKALSNIYLGQLLRTDMFDSEASLEEYNRFCDVDALTKAIILSGSNKLVIGRKTLKTRGKLGFNRELISSTGEKVHIGTDSVNYSLNKHSSHAPPTILTYYGGFHSVERRALVIHSTSLISPEIAVLFSRGDIEQKPSDNNPNEVILHLTRHRLDIHCSKSDAEILMKAREMIWDTFQYYVERDKSIYDENISRFKQRLFKSVCKLLTEAESNLSNNITNKVQNDYCDIV